MSIPRPVLSLAGDEACFEQRQREKYASAGPATNRKGAVSDAFPRSIMLLSNYTKYTR